jgi:SAM-dependent methyltransferase
VHEQSIATDYNQFHAGHPLLDLDRRIIASCALPTNIPTAEDNRTPGVVIDLGCGTGRNLACFVEAGWQAMGVDLSRTMLQQASQQLRPSWEHRTDAKPPVLIQTNMAQLECFASDIADVMLCMYSSLGMVQGRVHRKSVMRSVHRILRCNGLFILHVHNRGTWWRDPGGLRRMMADWIRSRRDRSWEYGDRVYAYRGLPSMYLHIYSERELRDDLADSGFRIKQVFPLNRQSSDVLPNRRWSGFRCGGWIVVCNKPAKQ